MAQPLVAVTSIAMLSGAPAGMVVVRLDAERARAACCTVIVSLATRRVPLRGPPVLALIDTCTNPLPDPAAPAAILIHDALLLAVQLHPPDAVTAMVTSSLAAATDVGSGATP